VHNLLIIGIVTISNSKIEQFIYYDTTTYNNNYTLARVIKPIVIITQSHISVEPKYFYQDIPTLEQ